MNTIEHLPLNSLLLKSYFLTFSQ